MKYCTEIKMAEIQQHATIWMNLGFKNKTVSPKHYFRHHIIFIKLKTMGIFKGQFGKVDLKKMAQLYAVCKKLTSNK